jgi:alpha-tubulin suppressor-like RCC1 family protein
MKNLSWFMLLFVLVGVLGACGSPAITVTGVTILSSSSETLEADGTVTLTANVTGTGAFNNAVTWSVVSGAGTLSNITDTSVVLKAPSLSANSVVQVRAVSVQDSSKTKDITFSVSSNGITVTDVSIEAALVALREGGSSEIQATVLGTGAFSPELIWTLEPSGFGTLSSTTGTKVTYTAPATTFGKVVRIIASSLQDSSKSKSIFLSVNPIKASIAAGGGHSLALKADGTLLSWGNDSSGQLGDSGSNTTQPLPVTIANASSIVSIAGGGGSSLALKADGTLLSWGNDSFGQLGDGGSNTAKSVPVPVFGATNIVAIAAGESHLLALKADGTMLSWGSNVNKQLGLGDSSLSGNQSAPVPVLNAANIVAMAGGRGHSLALQADGRLLSWGLDSDGQLGDGGTNSDKAAPTFVPNVNNIIAIAAGGKFSLALKADGTLLSWGNDQFGQLGDSAELTNKTAPVAVAGVTNVIAIAVGSEYALALKADGTLLSWGSDQFGQLGNADSKAENQPTFLPVQLAANIVAISAGDFHSLALKADGTLLSWGNSTFGQLGIDLTTNNPDIPSPVLLGTFNKIRVP